VGYAVDSEADHLSYHLVTCPSCHDVIFGKSWLQQNEFGRDYWDTAERIWPQPRERVFALQIPDLARKDLQDAQRCFHHGIYSAAAVLCGRALERLVKEKTGERTISKGLKLLKDQGVIDTRLFEWADALRHERNIGAHASEHEISKENAEDVIDFTHAIFDYVYTLSEKYQAFIKRKEANKAVEPTPVDVTDAAGAASTPSTSVAHF
jgi:HEPN domain-containing protein